MEPHRRHRLAGLAALIVLLNLPATIGPGARAQSPGDQPPKMARDTYKNLQVFTELPASELMPAMFFMEASLGVGCTHCHVNDVNFEKDDKPAKNTAREMIRMVRDLNTQRFAARTAISCNTCHRGQSRPSAPLAFAAVGPHSQASPDAAAGATPTVDQLFDRYIVATGGRAAQQRLGTLVMTGTKTTSEGWTAPLEIAEKSPARAVSTFQLKGAWRTGFDGEVGWSQDNFGVHPLEGKRLALFRLKTAFYRPDTLKALYADVTFAGIERVADRSAYVLEGTLIGAGQQRLFFDARSGLLLRVSGSSGTPFGPMPEEFDLEDYRTVAGVRLPFTVRDLAADFSAVDHVDKATVNGPVDDARFGKPR